MAPGAAARTTCSALTPKPMAVPEKKRRLDACRAGTRNSHAPACSASRSRSENREALSLLPGSDGQSVSWSHRQTSCRHPPLHQRRRRLGRSGGQELHRADGTIMAATARAEGTRAPRACTAHTTATRPDPTATGRRIVRTVRTGITLPTRRRRYSGKSRSRILAAPPGPMAMARPTR